ncbi:sigma-54-dependent transcriptional regulator [Thalassoglobus sp.]|uniref:sigma-54-dependent transcriptional regulator n=1 Tax=Thalassoglobus sp. TaxID=2795869 RepID=UPI003AA949A6
MSKANEMNLLIVEDDDNFREMAVAWMRRKGHQVEEAANAQEALKLFEEKYFQVAIFDMNMPGISGLELLQRVKSDGVETQILILTGQATIENAVAAMKMGACDYLTKPFPLADLEHRCRLAHDLWSLQKENRQLKAVIARSRPGKFLIGESKPMQDVMRLIKRVGPTDKAVLIQGESGTGKELAAQAIHHASEVRAEKPLVTINCAALPEQLVESELFGHEKGAFTGATATKSGLFEVADGGTLFIDEIGELPLSLQPKLLRVLEDGSFRRVGSHQERRVSVRIIAATNRDLSEEVADGNFREDLYYRINVMSLVLPPLRKRGKDVDLLINHFLKPDWSITEDALALMQKYSWPGNVRQLINALERATILAEENLVTIEDLPLEVVESTDSGETPKRSENVRRLDMIERAHIIEVLKEEQGNKARASRTLGIHRRKLYRLLERFEIDETSYRD